ncbi:MAG: cysteine--tRNA ligase, partial [Gemmataceae bacterium]|nr:cysteine--tRNA ligase [Gemmataceae bacterium]
TLDIHGGGLDLQFPHHENELAQSESANGVPFARVWMHNGLLRLGKEKMAGSVGNVVNVADALPHMSGDAIRFFILQTHYRSPIEMGNWTNDETGQRRPLPDNMLAAKSAHETFLRFAERVGRVTGTPFADLKAAGGSAARTMAMRFVKVQQRFQDFLDDDFNTGGAVGVLFDLVRDLNKRADEHKLEDPGASKGTPVRTDFAEGAGVVKEMAGLLGLTLAAPAPTLGGDDQLVSGLMQLLIDLRGNLRDQAKAAAKDNPLKKPLFDQTDLIRKRLAELGVTLEDRPGGTTWRAG